MTKKANLDKYKYFGCGKGFDLGRCVPLFDCGGLGKSVITFGADMSSSAHVDNKKKDIFIIFDKNQKEGLDNTKLTSKKEYAKKFSEQLKKSCLSLPYNGVKVHLLFFGFESINSKQKNLKWM